MTRRPKLIYAFKDGSKQEAPENPYYWAIGFFVLAFARVESQLNSLIPSLMIPHNWEMMTMNSVLLGQVRSVDDKVRAMRHLMMLRFGSDKKAQKRIALLGERIKTINDFRNELLHGEWLGFQPSSDDPENIRARVRRFQSFVPKEPKWKDPNVSLEEIYKHSRRCIRLGSFIFRIHGSVGSNNALLIAQDRALQQKPECHLPSQGHSEN